MNVPILDSDLFFELSTFIPPPQFVSILNNTELKKNQDGKRFPYSAFEFYDEFPQAAFRPGY
jgi:hypothetical protein